MQRLDVLKRLLKVDDRDVELLRAFAVDIGPKLDMVIDHFYEVLLNDPTARPVFAGGEAQVSRLRRLLRTWLEETLSDSIDDDYFESRRRIGSTHVQVGLPQHFMVIGIELIWREVERLARELAPPDLTAKLNAFHKILLLDLTIILESYKDNYTSQVRATERAAVAEKLTRAEHLAEIGQLAASLAHEIKNPLAGISGAIQVIRDGMPSHDPHRAIIMEILGQIHRLDDTVKDLLFYARPAPIRVREFTLEELVARVLRVLKEEPAMQSLRIEHVPSPFGAWLEADDHQLEQLVINLVINAAQASEEGGSIRLETAANGDTVQLIVEDRGKGMPAEVHARAFEPFFTTKAKGTGLGLAICRRIVDSHGGRISLHSTIGEGTKVVVDLPRGRNGAA